MLTYIFALIDGPLSPRKTERQTKRERIANLATVLLTFLREELSLLKLL